MQQITLPALRLKVTGACNRTCNFCHEEGDMKTIGTMRPDSEMLDCVHGVADAVGISKIMLTGGEPTIHPLLEQILGGIKYSDISITTNGIRPIEVKRWQRYRELGLRKVIVSMHDASPQTFVQLEVRSRPISWGIQAIESQRINVANVCEAGLQARVNVVAYHSAAQILEVMAHLRDLQIAHGFEIRILNDLSKVEVSQGYIREVCDELQAVEVSSYRRAGTSNVTRTYRTPSQVSFSTKVAYPFFFEPVCDGCTERPCQEGFYGIRIELRDSGYFVRLCIYKQTSDVLMPWQQFLASELPRQMREALASEMMPNPV
jgi:molybdenum cofactor biosynthesis enzyme MoaA